MQRHEPFADPEIPVALIGAVELRLPLPTEARTQCTGYPFEEIPVGIIADSQLGSTRTRNPPNLHSESSSFRLASIERLAKFLACSLALGSGGPEAVSLWSDSIYSARWCRVVESHGSFWPQRLVKQISSSGRRLSRFGNGFAG